jgi:hypothetical protein
MEFPPHHRESILCGDRRARDEKYELVGPAAKTPMGIGNSAAKLAHAVVISPGAIAARFPLPGYFPVTALIRVFRLQKIPGISSGILPQPVVFAIIVWR